MPTLPIGQVLRAGEQPVSPGSPTARFHTVAPATAQSFLHKEPPVPIRRLISSMLVAVVFVSIAVRAASATGYWNVPSTICQCFGYGCGAGYHAPLVLGPISYKGCLAINERRLPHAPSPPCVGHNCQGYGFAAGPPATVRSAGPALFQPPVSFVPPPVARQPRPLFLQ